MPGAAEDVEREAASFHFPVKFLRIICLLLSAVQSAPAVTIRLASFNIYQGFEAPGTDSFEQAAAVMARVGADVVGMVEATSGAAEAQYLQEMASRLGYPYFIRSETTPLDTSLRTAFFSRFPIVSTNWVQSPEGAVEMTRQNLAVKIDVPGTPNDPLVVVVHPKCCTSSSGRDSFRRAIEMRRIAEFVAANSTPALDNVFVIGDFNLVGADNVSFTNVPSGMPSNYVLGPDVAFPVVYRTDPDFYLSGVSLARLPMAQLDGARETYSTRTSSSSVLDYIMASAPVRARSYRTEIYNSVLDAPGAGLPKAGPVPSANASSLASDHYLLFGDFDLGPPPPAPVFEWPVAGNLAEGERLAESILTGGVAGVTGDFAFADPDFVPPAGEGVYPVVFAPVDAENYRSVTNPVAVSVGAAGPDAAYNSWLAGQTATRESLLRYALGGSSGPSATNGLPAALSAPSTNLSMTAIVRTNDPNLMVVGQAIVELSSGAWSTGNVTMTAGDQTGVAEGFERRTWSTPRDGATRKFLRLQTSLRR